MRVRTSGALRLWVHGWKLVDAFAVPSGSGSAAAEDLEETVGKYNFTITPGQYLSGLLPLSLM